MEPNPYQPPQETGYHGRTKGDAADSPKSIFRRPRCLWQVYLDAVLTVAATVFVLVAGLIFLALLGRVPIWLW